MKCTLGWLESLWRDLGGANRDAAFPFWDVEALEKRFLQLGLEVDGLTDWRQVLKGFRVAQVVSAKPHPDADRLRVCQVRTATETVQVVCGATNVTEGMKAILAAPGATIPATGDVLQPGVLRGQKSHGMLCSFDELGLGSLSSVGDKTIARLADDTPLEADLSQVLGVSDVSFSLEVTPNRPDLLGVSGLVQELRASALLPFVQAPPKTLPENKGNLSISVHPDAAPFCSAFGLAHVTGPLKADALPVMRGRLAMLGLGMAYNAVPDAAGHLTSGLVAVDITNAMAFGHARPLHAFDADKVQGSLVVRMAQEGEGFQALNGQTYELHPGDLVVADQAGVLALAGVMGGQRAAVTDATTSFYMECALFEGPCLSKTARRLGLVTDALLRFERGVDPTSIKPGLAQAVHLLEKAGGACQSWCMYEDKSALGAQTAVKKGVFYVDSLRRLTGCDAPADKIQKTLAAMGLSPERLEAEEAFQVTLPTHRPDFKELPLDFTLKLDEDGVPEKCLATAPDLAADGLDPSILQAALVEELIRLWGHDVVQSVPLPAVSLPAAPPRPSKTGKPLAFHFLENARTYYTSQGLDETINWSFILDDDAGPFAKAWKAEMLYESGKRENLSSVPLIPLRNPVSQDMSVMRPALLPGLLRALSRHQVRNITVDPGLFEVGTVYDGAKPGAQHPEAAFVLTPSGTPCWNGDRASDLWTAKGLVEGFLRASGLSLDCIHIVGTDNPASGMEMAFDPKPEGLDFLHPGQSGAWLWKGRLVAAFGALHPMALKAFDLKGPVFVGFVNLELLNDASASPPAAKDEQRFQAAMAPYQRLTRDFGMVVPQDVPAGHMTQLIQRALGSTLADVSIFDVRHDGHKWGTDKKTVALRLTLQPTKKPADEAWLEAQTETVLQALKPCGAILQRDAVVVGEEKVK